MCTKKNHPPRLRETQKVHPTYGISEPLSSMIRISLFPPVVSSPPQKKNGPKRVAPTWAEDGHLACLSPAEGCGWISKHGILVTVCLTGKKEAIIGPGMQFIPLLPRSPRMMRASSGEEATRCPRATANELFMAGSSMKKLEPVWAGSITSRLRNNRRSIRGNGYQ